MSLKELSLKHEYRSDKTELIKDFYTPCLKNATRYCRAVAYFSSNGLQKIVDGLPSLISNGGHISLVTGPKLTADDIEAIKNGYEARTDGLNSYIDCDFDVVSQDRLMLLTWLIVHKYLDIKIAVPTKTNKTYPRGVYHEKIGIFLDSNSNAVSFSGSSNETVGGLINNFESIDVHWSWDDTQGRVQQKIANFQRLWENNTDKLEVVDFLNAVSDDILINQTVYETEDTTTDTPEIIENTMSYLPNNIKLRDYQDEAIDAWFQNSCHGLWEMATGTGKTITTLSALAKLREEKRRLFVVIVCPYQHLVDQWHEDVLRFGFKPILAYKNSKKWIAQWGEAVALYNWCVDNEVCIITTYKTYIGSKMQALLSGLKNTTSVFVADEVHHFGAEQCRRNLPEVFDFRLGLSATPNRWFDQTGTDALRKFFGETVYEYPLDKAIEEGFLCKYYYHPHLVDLTEDEFEEYEHLTEKIGKLYYRVEQDQTNKTLEHLLIKRARLLNNATNKLSKLNELLEDKVDSLHHTLFYCAPGKINPVLELLNDLGLRIAKFTAEESSDKRQELLEMFDAGHLQALVAMKCLDEGVDVPSTQTAYILASSSNPKEFIQRRGRILRQFPGKEHAEIHDLIAVPPAEYRQHSSATFDTERKIIQRELKRFSEFAGSALNEFSARDIIWQLAKDYNLLDIFGDSR